MQQQNRRGDVVERGGQGSGGFTGLTPDQIWYCGKRKNQCKCGRCDGRCGPTNGCPCQDCFELIKPWFETNRCGDVVNKGGRGTGGFTGLTPDQIWYCGKKKNQCKCGCCDGRCGPTNGCPCQDCFELIKEEVRRQKELIKPWFETNRCGDVVNKGGRGTGGFTGLTPDQIWYCGKKKNQCKCGCCDGRCGPTNGCPCQDCFELIKEEVRRHKEEQERKCRKKEARREEEMKLKARRDTEEKERKHGEAEMRRHEEEQKKAQIPAEDDLNSCVICMDESKTHIFVPCGHMCVCAQCAETIMSNGMRACPICKTPATAHMKVYLT